jgi:hypothetical protein
VTHLVDDVDCKDGKFYAKVSEVRPVAAIKAGGALRESVLAYKELLLPRDWKAALDACQMDEPDESTSAALLTKLQEALEKLHRDSTGNGLEEPPDEPRHPEGGEDEHGLPDTDPGFTEYSPF